MIKLTTGEVNIVVDILRGIENELFRCYWNKNHKELNSPFANTGMSYKNDVFEVNAYYWGDDETMIHHPNFKYQGLKVWWYKYLPRGCVAECDQNMTMAYLIQMHNDCIEAIRKDFGEYYDED